jgi:hypothetical protein
VNKAYPCGIQKNIKREKRVRKGEITINNINHFIYKSPLSHPYQSGANPITTPFLTYFTYLTLVYMCVNERYHGVVIKLQGTSSKFYQRGGQVPGKALVTRIVRGGRIGVVSMVNEVVVGEFQ